MSIQNDKNQPAHVTSTEFSFNLSLFGPSEILWFWRDTGTTIFEIFALVIQISTKQWTTEWQQLTACRMAKIFFPKPDKNKTKKLVKHGRAYMRRLIECTTGHNNLNYLQSKIYPEDVSELCRFCEEEPETFDHILNECPCFQQARFDILHNQPIKTHLTGTQQT